MSNQNPVLEKILEKEEKIQKDVQLIKKQKKANKLVIAPLLALLSGILIGILRILFKFV